MCVDLLVTLDNFINFLQRASFMLLFICSLFQGTFRYSDYVASSDEDVW